MTDASAASRKREKRRINFMARGIMGGILGKPNHGRWSAPAGFRQICFDARQPKTL
jgi:hypothetical protein